MIPFLCLVKEDESEFYVHQKYLVLVFRYRDRFKQACGKYSLEILHTLIKSTIKTNNLSGNDVDRTWKLSPTYVTTHTTYINIREISFLCR